MVGTQNHLIARYLDLLSTQQRVTAGNIANADTPGYRTRGFDFNSEFHKALEAPSPEPHGAVAVREVSGLPVKNDGNDVQLERELQNLSETAIRFSHGLLMMRNGLRSIRNAIHEGRGA